MEFTIETIVKHLESNDIYIPNHHRGLIWDLNRQSRFIESIFLGLPIPPLFVAAINDSGNSPDRLEIIDGTQRIITLFAFINNNLRLINLTNLDSLNSFYFNNLSPSLQRKFKNTSVKLIILDNTDEIVRNDVFNRVNSN